jgi:NADH:ubiquinone oxidoreductase subunit H
MLALITKTVIIVSVAILVRGTLPRYRVDQVINLNWKYLIFILIFFYIQLLTINLFLIS